MIFVRFALLFAAWWHWGNVCATALSATAQSESRDINSLRNALQTARSDAEKIVILLELAEYAKGEPTVSRGYAQEAYRRAARLGDNALAAAALNGVSYSLSEEGKYDSARKTAEQAIERAEAAADKRALAQAHFNLAIVESQNGNLDRSLALLFKALPIMEEINDKKGMATVLNGIGVAYSEIEPGAKARSYYFKSLAIAEETGDALRQAIQYNNIGDSYEQQKRYDSAIKYYERAYAISSRLGNKREMSINLLNLGSGYVRLRQAALAERALNESQRYMQETKSQDGLAILLFLFCELATLQGKNQEAIQYGVRAVAVADSAEEFTAKAGALLALSSAYSAAGAHKKAYETYKSYIVVRDSLMSKENKVKAALREASYIAENKDKEILLLKKDAEQQSLVRISLSVGLALVGVVVFVLVLSNSQRKEANALLQNQANQIQSANAQLHERNIELDSILLDLKRAQAQLVQSERLNAAGMLTAGVMHEINNPNAATLSALQIAQTELQDTERYFLSLLQDEDRASPAALHFQEMIAGVGESLAVALDGSHRIKGIVSGLQNFTKYQRDGISVQSLAEGVASACQLARYQFGSVEFTNLVPTDITLEAHWGEMNQAILNLIINAAQARASKIVIVAEKGEARLSLSVADNGEGMSQETLARIFEPFFTTKDIGNSGLGLSITKNILDKHKASIEVESSIGVGTTARIIFT
jgi:signal transduction histidine kinase